MAIITSSFLLVVTALSTSAVASPAAVSTREAITYKCVDTHHFKECFDNREVTFTCPAGTICSSTFADANPTLSPCVAPSAIPPTNTPTNIPLKPLDANLVCLGSVLGSVSKAPWHNAPVAVNVDFATCSLNCAKDASNVAVGISYPVWFDGQTAGESEDTYCYCLTADAITPLGLGAQCEPCGKQSTMKSAQCGVSLLETTGQSGAHSYALAAYFFSGAPVPPINHGAAVAAPKTSPNTTNSICLQLESTTLTSPTWIRSNLGTTFEACYLTCQADARSLGIGLAQPEGDASNASNAGEVDCYCLHASDVSLLKPSRACNACPLEGEFGGLGCGGLSQRSGGMRFFGVEAFFFEPVATVAKTFPTIL
ncbi:hypothetical protein HK101_007092 [Irineochytrium annulatum]|nr:hypothetical protein HK101_007092 [Irineochytrium annulatum]